MRPVAYTFAKTIIAGTIAFAITASPALAQNPTSETYDQLNLFGDVFERVRKDYVREVEDSELIENAINGMLKTLDPHSSYMNQKTLKEMQVQTRGEFGGLGIEVTMENGVVKVVSPIDETPAWRAGIKAGDYITHLDGEPVQGLTLAQAVKKMRGPVNSDLTVTVVREGNSAPFDVTITRDVIQIQSVRARLEGDVIYLRVTSFTEKTTSGIYKQVKRMKQENDGVFAGVILDLRNNPGGLLDQAVAVSDAFLDDGRIVSTRARRENDGQLFMAKSGDLADGKPIIVLINGGSASASEIVAGALQDHKRAIILGTKSFGKGSVQTIIPLSGRGAIRMTTALYYTPSGNSIQAKGIVPDVEVEQSVVQKVDGPKRRSESDLRGHIEVDKNKASGAAKTGTTANKDEAPKDYQLSYALDLMRSLNILSNGNSQKN
jgi:carboxyl-terminal processing protease